MSQVTLRKIRGSLVLGLLASLAAHLALYGGQHIVGGTFHVALMQITSVAALGFVALLGALAWTQSGNSADGSVLATRLRQELPSFGTVLVSTAAWYAAIEAIEPHHMAASVIALIVAIAAASYAVLRLAHAMADAVARTVIAVSGTVFSPRVPTWHRRPRPLVVARFLALTRRRFARPPPFVFAFVRA